MKVTDDDWLKAFGTDSAQIEPKPKFKKVALERHQFEAQLILDRPDLFGFGWTPEATETPQQTVSIGTTTPAVLMAPKTERTLFDDPERRKH